MEHASNPLSTRLETESTMSIPRRKVPGTLVDLDAILPPASVSSAQSEQRVPLFEKAPVESDPTRSRADLSSNFYGYNFKSLSVGPVL